MDGNSNLPFGVVLLSKVRGKNFGTHESRILVLLLTFTAYACFHASRKPLSIVKSVLDPEVSQNMTGYSESPGVLSPSASTQPPLSGWDPFNGDLGKARLGELDVAFLATYAAGMYYAGTLADRLDARKFLTFGMVSSGACVCLFGFGYFWNIHSFWYYFTVQVITGLLSSIGWPVVVAIVANWFEKTKRGLIMGVWNAHASVGNIVGSVVAAAVLRFGWGWSFLLPGISLMLCALVVYCFLVAHPKLLGPSTSEEENGLRSFSDDEGRGLLTDSPMEAGALSDNFEDNQLGHAASDSKFSLGDEHAVKECVGEFDVLDKNDREIAPCSSNINEEVAVQFLDAWNIPGVAVYAFCLFFVKLVAYTFLYWLPFYIRHTKIGGTYLSDKMAGYLSVIFDIGGVIGGIIAGHLSDKCNVRALIAVVFMYCAVPSLYAFRSYGGISLGHAVGLMLLSGIFVNGPYALITTAVSADLGTDSSLKGNAKALATVTAIIDGTGSVGAAIGPFITGYISLMSWTAVFIMLAISLLIAGIFLVKLVIVEVKEKMHLYQSLRNVEVQLELSDVVPA